MLLKDGDINLQRLRHQWNHKKREMLHAMVYKRSSDFPWGLLRPIAILPQEYVVI